MGLIPRGKPERMSKDAAYATSQARGRGNKATQLGPGTFVTCKATHFGEEYAKDLFGRAWRGARLSGVVEKPVGKHLWSVRFDADDDVQTLSSRQLTIDRRRYAAIEVAKSDDPNNEGD